MNAWVFLPGAVLAAALMVAVHRCSQLAKDLDGERALSRDRAHWLSCAMSDLAGARAQLSKRDEQVKQLCDEVARLSAASDGRAM